MLAALNGQRRIDGRTRLGLGLKRIRDALISDLGVTRWEDLSTQQRMLATRVIHKHLFAESIEVWLLENGPLKKNGTARPALGTNYLAITNSLRLDIQALGLERRSRAINPVEAIKAKIEAARQGGSS